MSPRPRRRHPGLAVLVPAFAASAVATLAVAGTPEPPGIPLTTVSVPQGTRVSGDVPEAASSDDQYVLVDADRQRSKYVMQTLVGGTSPDTAPSRLDLTVETGVVTGQEVRFEVHMLNHANGNWTRIGAFRAFGDTVRAFADIRHPQRFVDAATGAVWVRLSSAMPRSQAQGGYRVSIDQVEIVVTP